MSETSVGDREILRSLAEDVAEIADLPVMAERRAEWKRHNALERVRPMILIFPEGSWRELLPDSEMTCEDSAARRMEWTLRSRLYHHQNFQDDTVIEKEWAAGRAVHNTGWGLTARHFRSSMATGAWKFDPVIKTHADLDKIKFPRVYEDEDASARSLETAQELFGDILDVKLHGGLGWALNLIDEWTYLRGITQTFLDMVDSPDLLHEGMRRMSEGKVTYLNQLEQLGVLSCNNGNDYVGSGGIGYTDQLPQDDFDGAVRLKDMWGFGTAQTMSEVSPAMHEEFVLEYQLPVLERFGLNCYGCCEPLHDHLDTLLARVPNLRRVSISPWTDKAISAEKLGNQCIFSWKPNPATLAGVEFDAAWVREDIRETVDIARASDCVLEIIIKDTHTCNHQPERFDEWTKIAMEEATREA